MQTFTGSVYWPADPRAEEVSILDIAHHLSMLCRYTGACRDFYSVAEHSVLVSRMVPRKHALAGLLHDAPEAYLNDINRPVKHGPRMEGYRILEDLNWRVIASRFGLAEELPECVHVADAEALFHEQAAIMPPTPPHGDWGMGLSRPAIVRPELIKCWSWRDAKRFFLQRFEEIQAWQ